MLSSAPKKRALKSQMEDEEQEQITAAAETISHQIGIIEEILARVPVKTLLQFRCVSKPWLSLISDPSFIKCYNPDGASGHGGLFIEAYDRSSFDRYILFASHDGGPITHLLSLPNSTEFPKFNHPQNTDGLFLFAPLDVFDEKYFAFLFNPATRKIFKLPCRADDPRERTCNFYFLGFDEFSREHKIVNVKTIFSESHPEFVNTELEIKVFSLSSYSWRKIDWEFPLHPNEVDLHLWNARSLCLNNVMHFLIYDTPKRKILGFDLHTEKFSVMNIPPVSRFPLLVTIDGLLGVSTLNCNGPQEELETWILKDYNNQVWVKGQIFDPPNIMFTPRRLSPDVLSISVYDTKVKTITFTEVNISHEVLCSETLTVVEVGSYVESMLPLKNSLELLPLLRGNWREKKCATSS